MSIAEMLRRDPIFRNKTIARHLLTEYSKI